MVGIGVEETGGCGVGFCGGETGGTTVTGETGAGGTTVGVVCGASGWAA